MSEAPPLLFDRSLLRARLDRAAPGYGEANFLKVRAAEDAADRLSAVLHDFPLAVELGARDGSFRRALAGTPAEKRIGALIEADLSPRMLRGNQGAAMRLAVDEERLPFAPQSLGLVVSLLGLHWTNDLVGALIQIRRALKPDGLFMGAFFGGATLTELRQSLLAAEAEVSGGAGLRVSPFADGYDAAGLLQRAGFALPVSDVDRVTVRYRHPFKLMAELRAMGETNALVDRSRKPLTRAVLGRAFEIYQEKFGLEDGRFPATFEIVSVAGWAPHESQQQPLKPGSAKMRLADALNVVEHKLFRTMRRLTEGEERLARSVFGDAIDYARVRLVTRGFGEPAVTLGSWITFPTPPPADFARAPLRLQAWFIHEMTHVWQFQGGWIATLWSWLKTSLSGGYGRGLPGYSYRLPLGAWGAYNLEQQASMVEHAFVLREQGACASAPDGARLCDYEGCVPFLARGDLPPLG